MSEPGDQTKNWVYTTLNKLMEPFEPTMRLLTREQPQARGVNQPAMQV